MVGIYHCNSVAYVDQFGDERGLGRRRVSGEVAVELVAEPVEDAGQHGRRLGGEIAAGAVVDGPHAVFDGGEVRGGSS